MKAHEAISETGYMTEIYKLIKDRARAGYSYLKRDMLSEKQIERLLIDGYRVDKEEARVGVTFIPPCYKIIWE